MWGGLSPEAQKTSEEAAARWRWRVAEAEWQRTRMQLGPRLEAQWLIIPSDWYNEDAKSFWKSLGARFLTGGPEDRVWVLDTSRARYKGRRYGRWAWLKSVRRRFYGFYPSLKEENGVRRTDG